MKTVENQIFDEERAFYGTSYVEINNCTFQGAADGESAFKECKNITVNDCYWDLRYPFWHDDGLNINSTEFTGNCRAALWYSKNITVKNSKLHGIKALRECSDIDITDTSIVSPEFGWFVSDIRMENCKAESEYFMLRSEKLNLKNVELSGKYSFQYITDSVFENCVFNTKDAFWHAKNVVVKNSIIKGEYLAWYAENITFDHCTIIGTQPLCYCKGLKLIDCKMEDADLSFEKSDVDATLISSIISIKNPTSGIITVPSVEEIIRDDPNSACIIEILK
ncbi:MAG: DUF3737 family protein [Clostridia bacterium]|nr:DUF3737 family protein [Clostridia bacterium]